MKIYLLVINFFVIVISYFSVYLNAKQKHLGCKKGRGQSEAACKQAGATKSFDIS